MLENIKGDIRPTKDLHNYIHTCMEKVLMRAYTEYLNYDGTESSGAAHIRKFMEIINERKIKE